MERNQVYEIVHVCLCFILRLCRWINLAHLMLCEIKSSVIHTNMILVSFCLRLCVCVCELVLFERREGKKLPCIDMKVIYTKLHVIMYSYSCWLCSKLDHKAFLSINSENFKCGNDGKKCCCAVEVDTFDFCTCGIFLVKWHLASIGWGLVWSIIWFDGGKLVL